MSHRELSRRDALRLLGAGTAALACGMPRISRADSAARVVVVGGGFGGATAAKYLRQFAPALDVTLVEPATRYFTCPFTNLYLGGLRDFDSLGHDYATLRDRDGVRIVHDTATDVDANARTVTLASGAKLPWDRLVLSPGIDIQWGKLAGYDEAAAERAPHAWKAGAQTHLLHQQLRAMPDGGTFVLVAPENPFRCPPGPYERVSMVAHYLKHHKPRSKVLLLDSKDAFSKQGLFLEGWRENYGTMVEWIGRSGDGRVIRVDADRLEVESEFGKVHKAAVLNVVPPQKAGWIAHRAGVVDESGWVPVHPVDFQSKQVAGIHVVGDAAEAAPMPKSGFVANTQAKIVAAAVAAALTGTTAPTPKWSNTCYSVVAPDWGITVANVYEVHDGQLREVPGSGGVSPANAPAAIRKSEARYAESWYAAITKDVWGTAPAA